MASASSRWIETERKANDALPAPHGRCEACHAPLEPQTRRRGPRKRTCSPRCRSWLWRRNGDPDAEHVDFRRAR